MVSRLALALAVLATATPALGHEFWLKPQSYEVPVGGQIVVDLFNGERFEGTRLPYLPQGIERFDMRSGDSVVPVESRIGDRPALDAPALANGLTVIGYVSTPSFLTYDDWDIFMSTVAHKDLLGGPERVAALHDARGLPRDGVTETFTRYSKTLIAVGDGAGSDAYQGFRLELVALDNPYTLPGDGPLRVQLLSEGAPRPDTQIEVFRRRDGSDPEITTVRTDAEGIAEIAVTPGQEIMLDSVLLELPLGEGATTRSAMWQTLWAT